MSSKEKKLAAAAEEAKKNKKFYTKCIIFIVCLAIVVAAAALVNSSITTTKTTALSVGETDYSPVEFNYFYRSTINSVYEKLYQTYGDLTSYLIDSQTPLSQQPAMYGDGEQTWAEYFTEQTRLALINVTVLADAAKAEGMTLTEEDKAAIDAQVALYEEEAKNNGYKLNDFLSLNFGKGFKEKHLRAIAELQCLATAYSAKVEASLVYTPEQLEEYYSENSALLDMFSFHSYFVGTSNSAFENMSDEEKIAAAHEAAQLIADAASPAQFTKNVQDFVADASKPSYEDPDSTLSITQGMYLTEAYTAWMTDAQRAEGDTTVIDSDGGSYAIYFASRNNNHYALVDARHILIKAEADENGEYTEEALETAKAEAERIHELWLTNPTPEYFAELATEYSQDEASSANGGLYEGVYKNYMVDEFNDFLFEEGSVVGDNKVVYGNNGGYAGYHVVYLDAVGNLFSDEIAKGLLLQEDYNAEIQAMADTYEVSEGSGMKFVNLD